MTPIPAALFASLRDAIHERDFTPVVGGSPRIGAEVELLAHDPATNTPVPLLGGPRSLIALLRRHASQLRWTEIAGYGAVPKFAVGDHAVVSFEPGGQLEISTQACDSVASLTASLRGIVGPLTNLFAGEGIALRSIGIDPYNDAPSIPQQLPVERYARMTEYFERIGPFGIRMMRQTAAIQVSLDRGPRPLERWRLLNDLAPYVTAIFANSARYLGTDTGHVSYRAHCWRMLDATRTGMSAEDPDPAAAYLRFALGAHDMMWVDGAGSYRSFGDWLAEDGDTSRWNEHLTTLFPEVRPRGHYEVRSCDAIDPRWYAAPIVFLSGLAYDERASREASLLASESRALLRMAGELGMHDAAIARTARDLFQLALGGARRLGPAYVGAADIEIAEAYVAEYTNRDRAPADDRIVVEPPARAAVIAAPST